ncbi:predicted protein [Nematostella vectensis]|uniref:Uncharacterized protein n=1 Tax=Nematostella vectensis TaxID=45351 RepID=A7T2H0_NEMVE|nr:predicted protein [Nematostella vectensis]|eukprot:XP_001621947.1 hypothetical protein NEMVEDRAFT_v1g221372 [Nematostella vectensis]
MCNLLFKFRAQPIYTMCLSLVHGHLHKVSISVTQRVLLLFVLRAQPIEHNVYTLDHFIELVEKIERHKKTSLQGLMGIAQMIRNMAGYVDDLWEILLGTSTPLPVGVLTTEERNALVKMTKHQFNGLVEEGVVRIGNDTIAMGPVILGIIAGISRKSRVYLDTWSSDAEDPVDNLFTSTIAGDLARTGLRKANDANRALFGPGGTWNSLPCSSTYTVTTSQISDASDALLLGDVDGFLLGYGVSKWAKKGVRLGQLLRMYYSNGVCYDETFQA